ncbi:sugar ABC transporter substrate-binding protein [Streptomyces sp. NBC_01294]|uniref:sugar ABC transporter substrate-binding protein n=1 Tax=Streptomyces sp. NBC_01294 TaxID=2903815 RepID=UPI002DDB73E3|nr:sugar ABC transporter substrate-binding protein [Streptomyces sp. NBC_01294]WRZ56564.1 sugar ABC transporter substrate-binding protein [Streptomyces sp. NBC_01294]
MLRRSRTAFASIGFTALAAVSALTLTACGSGAQGGSGGNGVKVGLITKTDTNPFFVKMKAGAEQAAKDNGVELVSAAGKFDGDNAGQVTAIENMVNSGVKGILITPNDSKAIVPALEKARAKGVLVIALDSPTDPQDATDALFATDNVKAGELIGQYAKAAMAGKEAKIATLDLAPGVAVGVQRHQGFLKGFGVAEGDPSIVCMQDTGGDQAKGQTAMENCLQKSADINVVYTINEPAALGAYTALKAKGLEKKVLVVSVDGGCTGTKAVKEGKIAATSQQYPLQMASQGVKAVADFAKNGRKASGYTDTGVTLVTDAAKTGVDSKDTAYGLEKCWG